MRVGIAFAGLLMTAVVAMSFSGGAAEPEVAGSPVAPAATDASPSRAAASSSSSVRVFNFGFEDDSTGTPTTLIAPGDSVFWYWTSGVHTVTDGTGTPADLLTPEAYDSGTIRAGDDQPFFERTFTATGVYEYYCFFHPTMHGVVVVA